MTKPNSPSTFIRRSTKGITFQEIGAGQEGYQAIVATWLIDTVLMFGLYKKLDKNRLPDLFEDNSHFVRLTGFSFPPGSIVTENDQYGLSETNKSKLSNRKIASLLVEKRNFWDKRKLSLELPLIKNIATLGRNVGLSDADMACLFFAAFNDAQSPFENALSDWSPRLNAKQLAKMIGYLSGYPETEISRSLHPDSSLARLGLLTVDDANRMLENKLDLMRGLVTILSTRYRSESELLGRFINDAGPGELSLEDFEHLDRDVETLSLYLDNAVARKEKGVNILLYGPPGTGKTELSKALAKSLGFSLFEVAYKGADGKVLDGEARLKAFNFCQRILEKSGSSLVMFDEVEDVFSSGSSLLEMFGLAQSDRTGKAWINRTMETNPVPSIWITNNPDIDPAFRRRFDYSIRFPTPPKHVRVRMAERHLGKLSADKDWLANLASHDEVSPAQFRTAAKVARIAGKNAAHRRELAELTLDRSMRLLEQAHRPAGNSLPTRYDLSLLNPDRDLTQLSQGLKHLCSGTLCFYGPPGTGKSELARYLAEEMGKPLLLKRASDLMSKWVGETEKKIALMFDEARDSDAVLLLDEADSFLQDRRGVSAQWEVTQVNELLTQMEAFDGVFICTTNLMQNLDQASLRRFAFKIRLDYLRPEQSVKMFRQEFVRAGGTANDAFDLERAASRLERLTPGDFAVVMRQLKFQVEIPSARAFYELLERECRAKEGGGSIGFIG